MATQEEEGGGIIRRQVKRGLQKTKAKSHHMINDPSEPTEKKLDQDPEENTQEEQCPI